MNSGRGLIGRTFVFITPRPTQKEIDGLLNIYPAGENIIHGARDRQLRAFCASPLDYRSRRRGAFGQRCLWTFSCSGPFGDQPPPEIEIARGPAGRGERQIAQAG